MIKFDIKLVVLYFFENLLLILILKCFARYLGLPLLTILACEMLWFAYFKEVVMCLSPRCISLCMVYSSVCSRTSNGLNMGEFDKCLKCTLCWGNFIAFLGRIDALYYNLYSYSHFMLGYDSLVTFAVF